MKEPHQAVEHKTTKRSKLHQGEGEDGAAVENVDSEERRLRRRLRRAQKLAKHLEELGLDENGNELDNFSLDKYPVREFKFTIPMMRNEVALNPTVTLIAIVCLWGLVLWCTSK